jgi:hypothetical protein
MDWLDTYSDPSVKAASVVTNLWIAAFALCSAVFALLGELVLEASSGWCKQCLWSGVAVYVCVCV